MKKKNSSIGVFDSGLGGLTVVKQIIKLLPHENIIYLGDTARVPYGTRSPETIKKFSEENTGFLLGKNVKCIVIACNTSSAVAADYLKGKFPDTPIFEVIDPAAEEAARIGKRIGVIGTRALIASNRYEVNIKKYSKDAVVRSQPCPLFVPFIEEGELKSRALKEVAGEYIAKLKGHNLDTLILGCTHYPIIESIIRNKIGKNVVIIDPGKPVSEKVLEFLKKKKLLNTQKAEGIKEFYVTDLTERFKKVAKMFLGQEVTALKRISVE